ncbi:MULTISPECIES: hypothetical protein [unclassified Caballeronia]|uniref:hypothetical protein n=1 Tax=unclassified Caballeronia TaxID=2646786 RepID=UPI00285B180D|nr:MULTISPECIES: hypothetical protein [unclassified Caballeronia]MDR5751289.1 hypothetical protein [Caballeronia sp. LZ024]MDR5844573.1 hypothetical protein [Caballeronia sp. LZ031]
MAAAGARDFWTVNGSRDFGFIPAGLTPTAAEATPVRLQRGDAQALWGYDHIWADHAPWVRNTGLSIPMLLLTKLSQPGAVYGSEVSSKFKVGIQLAPQAVLILKYSGGAEPFFGVTSLYLRRTKLDGDFIGRFRGCSHAQALLKANPVFELAEFAQRADGDAYAAAPQQITASISTRKHRRTKHDLRAALPPTGTEG